MASRKKQKELAMQRTAREEYGREHKSVREEDGDGIVSDMTMPSKPQPDSEYAPLDSSAQQREELEARLSDLSRQVGVTGCSSEEKGSLQSARDGIEKRIKDRNVTCTPISEEGKKKEIALDLAMLANRLPVYEVAASVDEEATAIRYGLDQRSWGSNGASRRKEDASREEYSLEVLKMEEARVELEVCSSC